MIPLFLPQNAIVMAKLFSTIQQNLFIIKHCFAGSYICETSVNYFEDDILDLNIPTYIDDRNNLRQDRNKVSRSFSDAVKAKKLELSQ